MYQLYAGSCESAPPTWLLFSPMAPCLWCIMLPRPPRGRLEVVDGASLLTAWNDMNWSQVKSGLLDSNLMDAALVVETSGVWVRAVQAAGHPGCPLLLQQLGHDGLHSLRGLEHRDDAHIVTHYDELSLTEISSSLFKSGSSSLKTEKKCSSDVRGEIVV